MGRNRVSNDADHVPIGSPQRKTRQKKRKAPEGPPRPWRIPKFTPMHIDIDLTYGRPNGLESKTLYEIFTLFLTDNMLDLIARHTNEYAALHPPRRLRTRDHGRIQIGKSLGHILLRIFGWAFIRSQILSTTGAPILLRGPYITS